MVPGTRSFNRAELVPGKDLSYYAYVNTTVHRNLYRISLPDRPWYLGDLKSVK